MRRLGRYPFIFAGACAALSVLGGCRDFPRDVEHTTEHIEHDGTILLGVVAGTELSPAANDALENLASQLDATIEQETASAEILIDRLEEGEIDVVLGDFAKNSVVRKDASLSHSIRVAEPADATRPALRLLRRHGENRWILLTDRVAQP